MARGRGFRPGAINRGPCHGRQSAAAHASGFPPLVLFFLIVGRAAQRLAFRSLRSVRVRDGVHGGSRGAAALGVRGGGGVGPAAGREVLQPVVPQRGGGRPGGDGAHALRRAQPRGAAPQDALPRLLRQGVRRLGAPGLHGQQHGGEGREAEPDAARLRLHREGQGRGGEGVPRHRLLRRRARAHGQGRRVAEQGPVLGGPSGPSRRPGVHLQRDRPAAAAQRQLHGAHPAVRRQEPRRQGPRGALRRPHHRHLPLLLLLRPPLQLHGPGQRARRRPHAGHALHGAAPRQVPQPGRQHHAGGDGPRQLQDLRPELLHPRGQAQGPLPLRRRPAHRPLHPLLRAPPRHRRLQGGVLRRLRRVHGEDGQRRRAHRHPGRDQEEVQRRQLTMDITCFILDLVRGRKMYQCR
ncbi:hypothetical protein BS78_09G191400 [Paspalum vaginatum]|nr:hypothetical protein BS78_09G191400 [Paspalum vaginatum]